MQDRRVGYVGSITLVVFGALLAAMAGNAQGQASKDTELERLNRFLIGCNWDNDTLAEVTVEFAPVRKLKPNEQPQDGTWQYALKELKENTGNTYDLTSGDRIHFVSTLHPSTSGNFPPYLWHVISVPRSSNNQTRNETGYVPLLKRINSEQEQIWTQDDIRTLSGSHLQYNGSKFFTYLQSGLSEPTTRSITNIWKRAFGEDTFNYLVGKSYVTDSHNYTHTFIYQDAPQSSDGIRLKGDRRNSSRYVKEPGKAFGFVLDDSGNCLAGTTLDLEP